ncbi:leucine-rich repeat protein 1 isoform X3 [Haemorhous mexicanus]|uniref:leucine-rich repeat protein 1 isoform X3 n=1 Tax=Haemorhous mexicanus TaxID=30427 RepID=UPI0028BED2E6|nr:leucine-rich repeat protein 1 isoform X3 [Haemorhous mexicanus]
MRLQCEVEVLSRLLPTCGLRGRGRAARALLSLGRPPGAAGAGIYLMVCTARDRGGARYKVQQNVERLFTRFVEEGKATVRLREPAVDLCLSKGFSARGKCDQFKDFPFSRETGSPRQRHRSPPSLTSGPSKELRRGETQNQNDHHFQEGLSPHQELPFLPGAPADLVLQAGQDRQQGAVPEEAAQAGPEPQPHQAAAGHAGGPGVPAGARPARQPPGGLQRGPVQLRPAEIPAAAGPEPEPDPGSAPGVLPAAGPGAAAAGRQRPAAPALPHRAAEPPALPVGRAQQAALPALGLQEPLPGEPGPLWESFRAAQPAGSQHPAEDPLDSAGVCCQGHRQSQDPLWLPPPPFPPV